MGRGGGERKEEGKREGGGREGGDSGRGEIMHGVSKV